MKYPSIHIEGAILSADILDLIDRGELRGQKPDDFGLEGPVKDEVARAWADVQDTWRIYQRRLERLKENDRGTTETRNQWIVPLLGLLGYKLQYHQRGSVVDGRNYAISHRDESRGGFPVHIMGYRDSLDRKREDSGPRMSPHALVQEYLNLTEHVYAVVTNGRQLRLLRDSTRLVKLSYIEFDLQQMIEEGHFADFAIFFRLLHATRMPVAPDNAGESLIEQYHQDALDSGSRIRDGLSKAVEKSIVTFANGFLRHPDNEALRQAILDGEVNAQQFYQYQLRLIYRLLFLMVIEERNLVYPDGSDRTKRQIYDRYYSVSNLRRLAGKRHLANSRHKDYWMALRNTFRLFEHEKYGAPLGIKPLAGDLFSYDAIRHLNVCSLDNSVLISCLTKLSVFEHPETHQRIRVNYAALNVEEFGSVYEGLLEYEARIAPSNGAFVFSLIKGSERATSGSHYTPDELVTPLIRNSLDHVIKRKLEEAEKGQEERALLSIKVCDVACGSGHILLNAARRIATELAIVRTGEDQPSPKALREAVRDVVRHCIYGVDLNPMAVELCKVALWLESHNPNEPLGFLDHHIKCGNAIIGLAHAYELDRGIPNEAFKKLPDDDKDTCAELRNRNKAQRKAREKQAKQRDYLTELNRDLRKVLDALAEVNAMPEHTPDEVAAKQTAYEQWQNNPDRRNLRIVADLQVAQFFIPKTPDMASRIFTDETYFSHLKGERQLAGPAVAEAMALAHKRGNKFFHWFLEFPEVFATGKEEQTTKDTKEHERDAWGGFDCILGNPPFLGGQKLSGRYGDNFLNWLKAHFCCTGSCDLITYFFRRNFALLAFERCMALIATNSISQGTARENGLNAITRHQGEIVFANPSVKWPGRAEVVVSLVAIHRGHWTGARILRNRRVSHISTVLASAADQGEPFRLAAAKGTCFMGSTVVGLGFVLGHDQAAALLQNSPACREVIFPYLNGSDLNSDAQQQASREIIFFRDWPRDRAEQYGECFSIVNRLVRPERQKKNYSRSTSENWWLFHRPAMELYQAIKGFKRVLVVAQVSKTVAFCFVDPQQVLDAKLIAFATEAYADFAVLQSSLHFNWAWQYCTTMKSDLSYGPQRIYETFPFPPSGSRGDGSQLASIGRTYHEDRAALMLLTGLGLTKTYNLFHTRDLTPKQVAKASKAQDLNVDAAHDAILALRERHAEMDNAVLKAYDWHNEVDLAHDFYEVDYLPENDNIRYTISPEARREILQRLLKLNHERHAEEVAAGVHEKKRGKKKAPKKKRVAKVEVHHPELEFEPAKQPIAAPAMPSKRRVPYTDTSLYFIDLVTAMILQNGGRIDLGRVEAAWLALGNPSRLARKVTNVPDIARWQSSFCEQVLPEHLLPTLFGLVDRSIVQIRDHGPKGFELTATEHATNTADEYVIFDAAVALAAAGSQLQDAGERYQPLVLRKKDVQRLKARCVAA